MLRDMWKVGPHEWFDHTGTSLRRVTFEISGHFLGFIDRISAKVDKIGNQSVGAGLDQV